MRVLVRVIDDSWGPGSGSSQIVAEDGPAESGTYQISVDCANIDTEGKLFRAFAERFSFPGYFGHNWDALNECLSDYFVLEDGGLGSEFGDRSGVAARLVRLVMKDVHLLAELEEDLLLRLLRVFEYVRRSNENKKSADLDVLLRIGDYHGIASRKIREIIEEAGVG